MIGLMKPDSGEVWIDDEMISAKRLLGATYHQVGKYSKAMEIFNNALTQSELVDNKEENGNLHIVLLHNLKKWEIYMECPLL